MKLRIARKILRRAAYCRRVKGRLISGCDGTPPKSFRGPRFEQAMAASDRWVKWKRLDPDYGTPGHYYDDRLPKRGGAKLSPGGLYRPISFDTMDRQTEP